MKKRLTTMILAALCAAFTMAQAYAATSATPGTSASATPAAPSLDYSKTPVIKGFCGGMMIHGGYLFGGDNPYEFNPKGGTFGLGGVAKIQFTKHIRAGFEGYFSTMPLKNHVQSGSHNKVFWTGALVDTFWKIGKFYPYIGTTVGGGMETAYYMFEGDKHDWLPEASAVFRKQPFFALDPFIGCDFAVGEALRLTLKADWLMAINNEGLNKPLGPRLYFGVIFAH